MIVYTNSLNDRLAVVGGFSVVQIIVKTEQAHKKQHKATCFNLNFYTWTM